MARLIAVDETAEKARAVAKRVAEWTIASYVGRTTNVRQGPARISAVAQIRWILSR